MNRHDITTSWRRSWSQRHPALSECVSIVTLWAAITALTLWIV